jgi:hypothetical protein
VKLSALVQAPLHGFHQPTGGLPELVEKAPVTNGPVVGSECLPVESAPPARALANSTPRFLQFVVNAVELGLQQTTSRRWSVSCGKYRLSRVIDLACSCSHS